MLYAAKIVTFIALSFYIVLIFWNASLLQFCQIIYEAAMKMANVDASDSIAVGDSLHHDIKGANAAGIQSAFITCGIHSAELGLGGFAEVAEASRVEALASKHDALPTYLLPAFTW